MAAFLMGGVLFVLFVIGLTALNGMVVMSKTPKLAAVHLDQQTRPNRRRQAALERDAQRESELGREERKGADIVYLFDPPDEIVI